MVGYMIGLSAKYVAFFGTGHIDDAVADAERELAAMVHQSGNGEVGQRKQGSSLTDMTPVKVFGSDRHLGNGMLLVNFRELTSGIGCEAVCTIQ